MKNILLIDWWEHWNILMNEMSQSFRLNFWNQVSSVITSDLNEAINRISNNKIDVMMIEPKSLWEYNFQDESMRGQAKIWIDFIKDLKSKNSGVNVVVLSDLNVWIVSEMLWNTNVEKIFSKPTRQKKIISTLTELLQIEKT